MIKKVIKLVITFENIVGLYRNYLFFGKVQKKLIILRVFFETALICACFRITILNAYDLGAVTEICYQIAINLSSLSIFVLTFYHKKNFRKCLMHFNNYKTYFPDDKINYKNLEKKYKIIMFLLIFVFYYQLVTKICSSFLDSEYYGDVYSLPKNSGIVYYIFEANAFLAYLRFIYAFAVIYCFIFLIGESIGCITRSIENEIQRETITEGNCRIRHRIQFDLFDKWSAAYATVAKISKLCNTIFGLQLTIQMSAMLGLLTMIFYMMTLLSSRGEFTPLTEFRYIILLMNFLIAEGAVLLVGQRASRHAAVLTRTITVLLLQSVQCESQYKAARDLLRQVRAHPIETRAFGSISVDMRLLPACVAFCTSYTVVALQFSNIV